MGLENGPETMSAIKFLCGPLCYIIQTGCVSLGSFNNCQDGLKKTTILGEFRPSLLYLMVSMCVLSQHDTFLILIVLWATMGEMEACRKKHTDP